MLCLHPHSFKGFNRHYTSLRHNFDKTADVNMYTEHGWLVPSESEEALAPTADSQWLGLPHTANPADWGGGSPHGRSHQPTAGTSGHTTIGQRDWPWGDRISWCTRRPVLSGGHQCFCCRPRLGTLLSGHALALSGGSRAPPHTLYTLPLIQRHRQRISWGHESSSKQMCSLGLVHNLRIIPNPTLLFNIQVMLWTSWHLI